MLDDVADMDKLSYLKRIRIDISGIGFAELNSDYVAVLKETLDAYGPLVNVNEITLDFNEYGPAARSPGRLQSGFTMDKFEVRLADFVDCFDRLFPNRRMFNIHAFFSSPLSATDQSLTQAMTDLLVKLFGNDICHFSFSKLDLTDQMASYLQACALRHISLTADVVSNQHMELIRRSRASLEYLSLCSQSYRLVPNTIRLIDNDGDDDEAPVYPRLKTLHLNYRCESGEPVKVTCSVNPFPALEVFTGKGLNHSVLIKIAEHIKPTVRVLELDIENSQIGWSSSYKIFNSGPFKRLESLLLREFPTSVGSMHAQPNETLFSALNMSPVARSVTYKVNWESGFSEDMFSSMIFSDNLRSLDLGYTYLTITQAVRLFNGFNRLYKASLGLEEESSTRSIKMPAVEEIQQFRARFKGQSSGVRIVRILTTSFYNSRRAGEYIVLMTDVLPNVEQVVIKDYHYSSISKIINGVTLALKRSVYKKDARLGNIVYSIEDFRIP